MAKRKGPTAAQIAAREAAAARRAGSVIDAGRRDLRDVAGALVQLEDERRRLLARRDELVAGLRRSGVPWDAIAGDAGTTRGALLQRVGGSR